MPGLDKEMFEEGCEGENADTRDTETSLDAKYILDLTIYIASVIVAVILCLKLL